MKRRLRSGTTLFVVLWLLCGPSLSAIPAQSSEPTPLGAGETVGIPWGGAPGITETVAQIMERERLAPAIPAGQLRVKPEFELTEPRRENPSAPPVSQWPPAEDEQNGQILPYNPQTVGTSFLGTQLSESAFIPPDTIGAVGPTQVLIPSNGRIKVFDRSGVLGGLNVTSDTFFSSVRNGSSTSDPRVRYDRLSGRWFLTMINVSSPNRVMIAVSSSSTITNTSSFIFFQFQHDLVGTTPNSDTGGFADYDTLGVDANALYIGVNVFNAAGNMVLGTTGFVVNKANLLASTLTVTAFRQLTDAVSTPGPWTPQGVTNDDPAATEGYFIGVDFFSFSQLDMRRISNPGGAPSISSNIVVGGTVPATDFPLNQPAQGSTISLDALDDRLFAAAIHKNRDAGTSTLWTAHNIGVNSSGVATSPTRNGSRWYQIGSLTTTPAVIQAGTLFDSAASNPMGYWIPSVAMSGQGHVALGSSRAGSTEHAEIAVAGRLSGDALGTIQAATLATASSTAYNVSDGSNPHRWGDYSVVNVDPNDDMTMWTFQEYCNTTNSWGVQAIQLLAPPPATSASCSPPTVTAGATADVVVTGTSSSGSGFFDPDISFSNHISAQVNGGNVTVNSVTYTDPTHITINLTVDPGAALTGRTVTVTNPDGQFLTTASPILTITTPPPPSIQAITPTFGPMVGGTVATIFGAGFQAGATVTIGGVAATGVTFVDSTSLTGTTGAHAAGAVDVVVTNPDAQIGTLSAGFTYSSGVLLNTLTPCRVIDTRKANGAYGSPALVAGADRTFVFTGQCGIPSGAVAVSLNVVAINPTAGPGFLTLYPGGTKLPLFSTINYNIGKIRANNAVVPLGAAGDIAVHCGQGGGTADMVIDVDGYFQ